jgi:hypothetical protein
VAISNNLKLLNSFCAKTVLKALGKIIKIIKPLFQSLLNSPINGKKRGDDILSYKGGKKQWLGCQPEIIQYNITI